MANCGCKPCSKPLPKKTKACKPFTICVGNYSLIWDGECASIQERTYQIPDGTYTSITFQDGCIVGVGQAPIPQYTPQQCCDVGEPAGNSQVGTTVSTGNVRGNLAIVQNGTITVAPNWDINGNIKVTGFGTADNPWKPSLRISGKQGNTLVEETDGLFANLFFKTTETVSVTGKGTKAEPYALDVKSAEVKLPSINKVEIEGNGFTIDEYGRWKADENLKVITNLKFDHPAFSVIDQGISTLIAVNTPLLRNGVELQVGDGLSGKGVTDDPIKFDLTDDLVGKILDVVQNSDTLKQRLKMILEV